MEVESRLVVSQGWEERNMEKLFIKLVVNGGNVLELDRQEVAQHRKCCKYQ